MCGTMPSFCKAGDQTQGFMHARPAELHSQHLYSFLITSSGTWSRTGGGKETMSAKEKGQSQMYMEGAFLLGGSYEQPKDAT